MALVGVDGAAVGRGLRQLPAEIFRDVLVLPLPRPREIEEMNGGRARGETLSAGGCACFFLFFFCCPLYKSHLCRWNAVANHDPSTSSNGSGRGPDIIA